MISKCSCLKSYNALSLTKTSIACAIPTLFQTIGAPVILYLNELQPPTTYEIKFSYVFKTDILISESTESSISKYLEHNSEYFYNTGAKYINPILITLGVADTTNT